LTLATKPYALFLFEKRLECSAVISDNISDISDNISEQQAGASQQRVGSWANQATGPVDLFRRPRVAVTAV